MTPEQFVECLKKEKDWLLAEYFRADSETECAQAIRSMGLSPEQMEQLAIVMETAFTDVYYGILLGLDGAAALGGEQHSYTLLDEDGLALSGGLEEPAWTHFQE